MKKEKNLNGSHTLMHCLIEEGIDTVFGYPGGTIMPVYDALYDYSDKIRHILVRHEQAAVHAAEGYARATGKTGVCIVTSGPGATNTITGIADAMMDSTPLVVISGQVGTSLLGTDAFQETNFIGITQAITKWNILVKSAKDIPAAVAKAFYIARSGRPGPVVVDFTKSAQMEMLENFSYEKIESIRSYKPRPEIDPEAIECAAELINSAERPMAIIGQGVILSNAEEELKKFLKKTDMPVASSLLGLSALPTGFGNYAGMAGMHGNYAPNVLNKECDLILAVGIRFDDRLTGDPKTFGRNAKIIHIDIDASEINKIIRADVPVVADAKEALTKLTEKSDRRRLEEWNGRFREAYRFEYKEIIDDELHPKTDKIRMGEAVNMVSEAYKGENITVTDVGQHQMVTSRYSRFNRPRSLITSGGLGTMGFGLPAAIGAAIGAKDRDVCLFVGDGGIQMSLQELATIMQYNVPVKIILLNNSFLGMVRQWQELFYESRYSFTHMTNPDFSLIAGANGIKYGHAEKHSELAPEIEKMKRHKGAYLLEIKVENEDNVFPMVPTGKSLDEILLK